LRCPECGIVLAAAGARSFVVDIEDEAINFSQAEPPEQMKVAILCPNGHRVLQRVPEELSAEEALAVPDDAPVAHDALLMP
jgi:hypothetical protein